MCLVYTSRFDRYPIPLLLRTSISGSTLDRLIILPSVCHFNKQKQLHNDWACQEMNGSSISLLHWCCAHHMMDMQFSGVRQNSTSTVHTLTVLMYGLSRRESPCICLNISVRFGQRGITIHQQNILNVFTPYYHAVNFYLIAIWSQKNYFSGVEFCLSHSWLKQF